MSQLGTGCEEVTTKPLVGIVGPCSAGKSVLARRLRAAGYEVREIRQEHSVTPTMWQRLTHPDHLPPSLLPGLFLDRDDCLATAAEVGPATSQVVQSLLGDPVVDRLPSVGRLLRLRNKYGAERLEAACQRALDGDDPAYKTVKSILAQNLDGQPLPDVVELPPATTFVRPHEELLGNLLGGEPWN